MKSGVLRDIYNISLHTHFLSLRHRRMERAIQKVL